MKKILSIVLTIAVLAGCSKNDIVGETTPVEIAFGDTFIDNITKSIDPSFTKNNLNEFKVWGFVDNYTGKMFDGELVWQNTEGNWAYTNKQFWLPNNSYYFYALSNNYAKVTQAVGDAAKLGLGNVLFSNNEGKNDLIYAAVTRTTTDLSSKNEYDNVKFTFNHLLSKVRFTFQNGFGNKSISIAVKDVTMEVPKSAEIDLAVAQWSDNAQWTNHSNEKSVLSFGNMVGKDEMNEGAEALIINNETPAPGAVSNYERFVIPSGREQVYTVFFTADVYVNDLKVYTQAFSTKITGVDLEIGMAYNFKATLGPDNIGPNGQPLEPIKFKVEKVNGWTQGSDQNI